MGGIGVGQHTSDELAADSGFLNVATFFTSSYQLLHLMSEGSQMVETMDRLRLRAPSAARLTRLQRIFHSDVAAEASDTKARVRSR